MPRVKLGELVLGASMDNSMNTIGKGEIMGLFCFTPDPSPRVSPFRAGVSFSSLYTIKKGRTERNYEWTGVFISHALWLITCIRVIFKKSLSISV